MPWPDSSQDALDACDFLGRGLPRWDAGVPRGGGLGIAAGAAVFVATPAVPLDDPALVVALALGLRGGRLILNI